MEDLQVTRVAIRLRNDLRKAITADDAQAVMDACTRYTRKYGSWPEIAEVKAAAKEKRDLLKKQYF